MSCTVGSPSSCSVICPMAIVRTSVHRPSLREIMQPSALTCCTAGPATSAGASCSTRSSSRCSIPAWTAPASSVTRRTVSGETETPKRRAISSATTAKGSRAPSRTSASTSTGEEPQASRPSCSSRGKKPLPAGGTDDIGAVQIERRIALQHHPFPPAGPADHGGSTVRARRPLVHVPPIRLGGEQGRPQPLDLLLDRLLHVVERGLGMGGVPGVKRTLRLLIRGGGLVRHGIDLSWGGLLLYARSFPSSSLLQQSAAHPRKDCDLTVERLRARVTGGLAGPQGRRTAFRPGGTREELV